MPELMQRQQNAVWLPRKAGRCKVFCVRAEPATAVREKQGFYLFFQNILTCLLCRFGATATGTTAGRLATWPSPPSGVREQWRTRRTTMSQHEQAGWLVGLCWSLVDMFVQQTSCTDETPACTGDNKTPYTLQSLLALESPKAMSQYQGYCNQKSVP